MNLFEYLNDLLSLFWVLFKVLLAKMKVEPIKNVAAIFTTKNATMLELTMPVIKGFNSTAPKYITPMAVVKQSTDPKRTRKKLGNTSDFIAYIEASTSLKSDLCSVFKNQIAKLDIFQIWEYQKKALFLTSPY